MVNFEELAKQNPWWQNPQAIESDPKIRDFESAGVKWSPRIRKYMDLEKDVLYSLRGPRQVGKTTLVKLMIRDELKRRKPEDIFYFTCDIVSGQVELKEIIETYIMWSRKMSDSRKLVVLDEINRVKGWESAYKFIIDTYSIRSMTFILTGSSSWDIKHGVERLGGRKGEVSGEQNHKILLPMKFSEYAAMRLPEFGKLMVSIGLDNNKVRTSAFTELMSPNSRKWTDPLLPWLPKLEDLLDEYLLTGGIMSAVNCYARNKSISNSIYELYIQLFFGDLAKLKRDEGTAKKILSGILKHSQSTCGWDTIASESGIPSQITVMQYLEVLKNLFVLNVYNAFDQNRKAPKHRSQKKVQITNPFFFHAFRGLINNPAGDYFREAANFVAGEGKAAMAEFIVGDHLARLAYNHHPSDMFDQSNSVLYVKNAKGETIDFIARLPDGFVPVEVKYQQNIKASDYANLKKFERGILVTKNELSLGTRHPAIPVPLLLMFI